MKIGCCGLTVGLVGVLLALIARVILEHELEPYRSPHYDMEATASGAADRVHHQQTSFGFCNFDREVCCKSTAAPVQFPATIADVQRVVRQAVERKSRIRVTGAGHSMSPLVCDGGDEVQSEAANVTLVSLDRMQRVLHITRLETPHLLGGGNGDPTLRTTALVEVEAGIRLIELNRALRYLGLGLKNMGLIQEQSVAGLIATGVHGSGALLSSVSTAVEEMSIVVANATLIKLSRTSHPEVFRHARLHLGLFGVVVRVVLQVTDAFSLERQNAIRPVRDIINNWDVLAAKYRNYQFWWIPGTEMALENKIHRVERPVGTKRRHVEKTSSSELGTQCAYEGEEEEEDVGGDLHQCLFEHSGALAAAPLSRLSKYAAVLKTDVVFSAAVNAGALLPWLWPMLLKLMPYIEPPVHLTGWAPDIFMYPNINFHSVRYTEAEYFVPWRNAKKAADVFMKFISDHQDDCPVNSIDPIRTVRGDDIPLSPISFFDNSPSPAASSSSPLGAAEHHDVYAAFSFVLVRRPDIFSRCLEVFDREFRALGGRPHWGKRHDSVKTYDDVVALYGKEAVDSFRAAVKAVDPDGVFTTKTLRQQFQLL